MQTNLRDWHSWLNQAMSFALPSSCALCGMHDAESLCTACSTRFFGQAKSRCLQCANLLPKLLQVQAQRCGNCLKAPPAFDRTWVAADYAPPLDQLVLSLKFASKLALSPLFARILSEEVTNSTSGNDALPDLIVPMPLAAQRLAERGFNQALEIARPLSQLLDIPLATRIISRSRETPSQSLLPLKKRAKNVRGAFMIPPESAGHVRGRHVAIVDDVMTSGATLNELASMLKRAGATRVSNFVVARALN